MPKTCGCMSERSGSHLTCELKDEETSRNQSLFFSNVSRKRKETTTCLLSADCVE